MKKTLIVGLGNPILADDGVGVHVVRALAAYSLPAGVVLTEACVGGLRLLEIISGYDRVILVDAIQMPDGQPGDIFSLRPDALQSSLHSGSAHDLSLSDALRLGRELGMAIPGDTAIWIVALQVADVRTLNEELTPAVQAAIPTAVEAILSLTEKDPA
jgi:hydrogenase maturation protease